MKRSNGFVLLEVLLAFSITFMLAATLIPIISMINMEKSILSEKRETANQLHDELQPYLWNNKQIPAKHNEMIRQHMFYYQFSQENNLIKGCVHWNNVKNRKEKICLYGMPRK